MEDFLLTAQEHQFLTRNKNSLEFQYNVQICVPEITNSESISTDVIFATIYGERKNIENVKNSLQTSMRQGNDESVIILEEDNVSSRDVPVITLSDDDDVQGVPILTDAQNRIKRRIKQKKAKKKRKVLQHIDLASSMEEANENVCEVSSTTERSESNSSLKSVVPATDFIPLNAQCVKEKAEKISKMSKTNISHIDDDDDVEVIESPQIENLLPKDPKLLRPIVIDGSNVAREHGKALNTFSCKGILLSVEYFLKRGHTQVTAFVPNFRRHQQFGRIPTTDNLILEELAKSQNVVFTPSRRVQGKRITCYDDRFIVELASKTGGVILSNDNYKDLMEESAPFKKTIEERLLMFCFVGDLLMIPKDPLGRTGPTLDEYLSFPESET